MPAPSFAARRAIYARQWADMKIEGPVSVIDKPAWTLVANKARYQAVADKVGVPWFFIAVCHWREASGSFAGVLHNGEKIIGRGVKTKLVPKGRGPFDSWEEAAIDALSIPPHDMSKVRIDSIERFAYECEKWNGFGYYFNGVPSAYLWSHSNIYQGGKYVADGVWDPHALDAQIGVMPLLKRMMVLDASIGFGPPPPDVMPTTHSDENSPAKTPATPLQKGAGGAVGVGIGVAAAKQAGVPWSWILIGLAVVGVGLAVWFIWSIRSNPPH